MPNSQAAGAPPSKEPRPFTAWLHEQRGGVCHSELTEQLAEVTQAVVEHGKTGTLTLTIKVAPGEVDGTIIVADEVKAKVPQPKERPTLFYADESGNLTRTNPRQMELGPLRQVGGGQKDDAEGAAAQ